MACDETGGMEAQETDLRGGEEAGWCRGMALNADEVEEELPWLDYLAAGGQSHVFGAARWVVKLPRRSWQSMLGRVLVHPATPARALADLGGLLEPFVLMERVRFRGPAVDRGRAVPDSRRVWSARWAVAGPRLESDAFLDRRMAVATPGEAADLMAGLLSTLEAIRLRGWHVLDFIMSNFVVGGDGAVRLVDAGLLVPATHLRGPSQQIASRLFVGRLARDYREVLAGTVERHPGDAAGAERLRRICDQLPRRLSAWRAGRVAGSSAPSPALLPPDVRAEIFESLVCRDRTLPLTGRHVPVYTPPHHAITSEN